MYVCHETQTKRFLFPNLEFSTDVTVLISSMVNRPELDNAIELISETSTRIPEKKVIFLKWLFISKLFNNVLKTFFGHSKSIIERNCLRYTIWRYDPFALESNVVYRGIQVFIQRYYPTDFEPIVREHFIHFTNKGFPLDLFIWKPQRYEAPSTPNTSEI